MIQNCTPDLNDEFDGAALSEDWDVLRRDDTGLSLADGQLGLAMRAGDLIGDTATAKNVLLKDAPDGPWVATVRLDVRSLTAEGQQAGLVLWNGEDPNTFAKIMFIDKGANSRFEHVATREDVRTDDDIQIGPDVAGSPREAYIRVRADGAGLYIPEFSLDGETWDAIAAPLEDLGDPDSIRFGVTAMSGADATAAARFLYFRVDCSDRVAPVSTASVAPAQPGGEHGWYTAPPTVTLAADDGAEGGIGKIEYSIDGGPLTTYGGPFTIDQGTHEVEYFATDNAAEPNAEPRKTIGLRVDSAAPRTNATLDRSAGQNGPVKVTLAAQDGAAGSGAVLTQYRVDGGPWKTYSAADEQLFDGTAAVARAVGPGRRRPLRAARRRVGRGHAGRRAGDAVVPGQAVRGLQAQVPVPRGADGRRQLQRRRVRPVPGPAGAGGPASRRVREDRLRGQRRGLGRDLLRPRDPALRRSVGRAAEDGLDLQLRSRRDR